MKALALKQERDSWKRCDEITSENPIEAVSEWYRGMSREDAPRLAVRKTGTAEADTDNLPSVQHSDLYFGSALIDVEMGKVCGIDYDWTTIAERISALLDFEVSDVQLDIEECGITPKLLEAESISPSVANVSVEAANKSKFRYLADKWYAETGMISMIHKKSMHPDYQKIIGMGKDALPFIFQEMRAKQGHWLWALTAIHGEDIAKPEQSLKEAVETWMKWGEENGYI